MDDNIPLFIMSLLYKSFAPHIDNTLEKTLNCFRKGINEPLCYKLQKDDNDYQKKV